MIAVVKIGGHQALVKVGEQIEVDKLNLEVGEVAKFETLLVASEDGATFNLGAPLLEGVLVEAKVLENGRGKKIKVFKMKPRKRYRRTQGHRQDYTLIEITSIPGVKSTTKKSTASAATKVSADKKAPAKKAAAKSKAPVSKKAPVKKAATKKPPVKKTAPKAAEKKGAK